MVYGDFSRFLAKIKDFLYEKPLKKCAGNGIM